MQDSNVWLSHLSDMMMMILLFIPDVIELDDDSPVPAKNKKRPRVWEQVSVVLERVDDHMLHQQSAVLHIVQSSYIHLGFTCPFGRVRLPAAAMEGRRCQLVVMVVQVKDQGKGRRQWMATMVVSSICR